MHTQQMKTAMLVAALAISAASAVPALAAQPQSRSDVPSAASEQPVTDTWITTKVKSELAAAHGVPGHAITVDTKNGTVWLSGDLKTRAEYDRAIAKARGIKGVKHVNASKLTVRGAVV